MNLQEFGQSVKAKYPQYNHVDDVELAKRMLEKYPQYQSRITDDTPATPPPPPKKTAFGVAKEAVQTRQSAFDKSKADAKSGKITFGEGLLRGVGAGAGLVGDLVGAGVKGAYNALPDAVEEKINKGAEKLGKTKAGQKTKKAVGDAVGKYTEFSKKNPRLAANLEAIGNVASLVPIGKGASALPKAVSKTGQVINKAGQAVKSTRAEQKVKSGIAGALRKSAEKDLEYLLAPTKEANKRLAQRVIPKLVDETPKVFTRQQLLNQARAKASKFGAQIDDLIDSGTLKGKLQKKTVLDFLENQKGEYKVENVVLEPRAIKVIDGIKQTLDEFDEVIEPETLIQIRRIWDTTVNESKGFTKTLKDGTEVKFKKQVTDLIRNELAKSNPNLDALNKQFSLWKNTETILQDTVDRKIGQSGAVSRGMASIGGAIVGPTLGLGAIEGALAAQWLQKAVNSPIWKTMSIARKMKIVNAIAKGNEVSAKKAFREFLQTLPEATKASLKASGIFLPSVMDQIKKKR